VKRIRLKLEKSSTLILSLLLARDWCAVMSAAYLTFTSQSRFDAERRRCKLLTAKRGEMSEWLKEHAWKTNPATLTERYRIISWRNRFKDFPPQNASRCEPVNVAVCQRFRGDLTQFLHSSQRHFGSYCRVLVGTGREL
jgi:hypothetical protein